MLSNWWFLNSFHFFKLFAVIHSFGRRSEYLPAEAIKSLSIVFAQCKIELYWSLHIQIANRCFLYFTTLKHHLIQANHLNHVRCTVLPTWVNERKTIAFRSVQNTYLLAQWLGSPCRFSGYNYPHFILPHVPYFAFWLDKSDKKYMRQDQRRMNSCWEIYAL